MKKALITGITGQDGSYLGEDDIVRFKHRCGRAEMGKIVK